MEVARRMSTATPFSESDTRTCHICQERFLHGPMKEQPHTLMCGHTFGLQCIFQWLGSKPGANCPICRGKTSTYQPAPRHKDHDIETLIHDRRVDGENWKESEFEDQINAFAHYKLGNLNKATINPDNLPVADQQYIDSILYALECYVQTSISRTSSQSSKTIYASFLEKLASLRLKDGWIHFRTVSESKILKAIKTCLLTSPHISGSLSSRIKLANGYVGPTSSHQIPSFQTEAEMLRTAKRIAPRLSCLLSRFRKLPWSKPAFPVWEPDVQGALAADIAFGGDDRALVRRWVVGDQSWPGYVIVVVNGVLRSWGVDDVRVRWNEVSGRVTVGGGE